MVSSEKGRKDTGDGLPDYLKPGLDVVFVGINPGEYSAKVGHYFARKTNRFWPAVNQAGLFNPPLDALHDYMALEQGIGFTDVVKRATANAAMLGVEDWRKGAPALRDRLLRYAPRIVSFNGMTGYRNYLKYGEGIDEKALQFGLQPRDIGASKVFVVPSPSPANAAYLLNDMVDWYTRLRELRDGLRK